MVMRTEAIKNFLSHKTHKDLADSYNYEMEVQVNVAQDNGTRIDKDFKGKHWQAWTDGLQRWYPIRIPRNAKTEPEYEDTKMEYDLAEHAEGIGMTGWNWKQRKSIWVGYDFDAIIGHSDKHNKKLTEIELSQIIKSVEDIPWVTLRKSTGGRGLHLYIYLNPVDTKNHNEHSALARSILGKLSALVGFDFQSKVDICGGNMWVWHRKLTNDGLQLIKQGYPLFDIPANWQDHINVVNKTRRKNLPKYAEPAFDDIINQISHIPLDEDHKRLIKYFEETNKLWWWDQDHHMMVTHTFHLKEAHTELKLKGFFETLAQGTNYGNDHNCFCIPIRFGAWIIRRFSQGCSEHPSWEQDDSGWTKTYYNREPSLGNLSRAYGGIEHDKGGFIFPTVTTANDVSSKLGANIDIPEQLKARQTKLREHKDGRLIVEIKKEDNDPAAPGWLAEKGLWKRIFSIKSPPPAEAEVGNYDNIVRHVITESGEDYGWLLRHESNWINEPLVHVQAALQSTGVAPKEIKNIVGNSVLKCWTLINRPFQEEYLGDRNWNRNAVQLRYPIKAEPGNYDSWIKILNHCGSGLDDAVKEDKWCQDNGILTGADYLKIWLASLFKEPNEPLPYLFFYGPQGSGKSIFHEALQLLVTHGIERADHALVSNFNAELENAIVCVVEETDLRKNKQAYNKIKDWVTSKSLHIHAKGRTPYLVRNTSHWIQAANESTACPIFPGDKRIVVIYVKELQNQIPKKQFIPMLEKEASDFLTEILSLELPNSNDRLNIPVVTTAEKIAAEESNKTHLELFISEMCVNCPGRMIKFTEFYDKFMEWIDPNEHHKWSKVRIGRELPPEHPRARVKTDNGQVYVGNISWLPQEPLSKLTIKNGFFV